MKKRWSKNRFKNTGQEMIAAKKVKKFPNKFPNKKKSSLKRKKKFKLNNQMKSGRLRLRRLKKQI